MFFKSLVTVGLVLGSFSCLIASDEPEVVAKSSATPSGNLQTLELLGQMISSDPFSKFNLNAEEVKALVKGFQTGLTNPLSKDDIMVKGMEVQDYLQTKLDEIQKGEQSKLQETMANIVFPMDQKISSSQGKEITLSELVKGKKAILLDFWASWCGPCMQSMPALIEKSKILPPLGIVVAGMNTEGDKAKAEEIRVNKNIDFPWLVEPENGPFSALLGIDSIPRVILVSAEGNILYNGHPSDEALHLALEKLGVPHSEE